MTGTGCGPRPTLNAGELARAAGVNRRTLRKFESQGLLPEPVRALSGQRRYPPEAVEILRVLNSAERLGLSRAEMVDLSNDGAESSRIDALSSGRDNVR